MDLLQDEKELIIIFRDLFVKEKFKDTINEGNLKDSLRKFVESRFL